MEGLTRLVSESMARHGFDRPLDYRRLRWSRWFRCESHHSLLFVPSKPGVFALAEEIMHLNDARVGSDAHVGTDAGEGARATRMSSSAGTYSVAGVSSRDVAKWEPMPVAFSAAVTIH